MEAVNLLPRYARAGHRWTAVGKRPERAPKIVQFGSVRQRCVAGIVLGGLYFNERSVVSNKKSELTTAQAQPRRAMPGPREADSGRRGARMPRPSCVSGCACLVTALLADVSRVLPMPVYRRPVARCRRRPASDRRRLCSRRRRAGTPAPAHESFTVNGHRDFERQVALVLDRLALLPWLSTCTLVQRSRADRQTAVDRSPSQPTSSRGGAR